MYIVGFPTLWDKPTSYKTLGFAHICRQSLLCLRHVGKSRCDLRRDPDRHHGRRCCARDMDAQRSGLCVFPGPQGRQEQGALRARQGRGVRAGQAGHPGASRQDQQGRQVERFVPARRKAPPKSCSTSPSRSIAAAASRSCAFICNMRWR